MISHQKDRYTFIRYRLKYYDSIPDVSLVNYVDVLFMYLYYRSNFRELEIRCVFLWKDHHYRLVDNDVFKIWIWILIYRYVRLMHGLLLLNLSFLKIIDTITVYLRRVIVYRAYFTSQSLFQDKRDTKYPSVMILLIEVDASIIMYSVLSSIKKNMLILNIMENSDHITGNSWCQNESGTLRFICRVIISTDIFDFGGWWESLC